MGSASLPGPRLSPSVWPLGLSVQVNSATDRKTDGIATPFHSSLPCACLQIKNVFIDYIPVVGAHTQVEAVVVFLSDLEKDV